MNQGRQTGQKQQPGKAQRKQHVLAIALIHRFRVLDKQFSQHCALHLNCVQAIATLAGRFHIDDLDRKILNVIQRAADTPLESIGDQVGLSRNAVWRRIKSMETAGFIRGRRTELDAAKLGFGLMVFMQIRTQSHDPNWQTEFSNATQSIPGILNVYRMTGDLDYLIRARVADMADYDRLYQQLIKRVPLSDVAASFVMEEVKDDPVLPL